VPLVRVVLQEIVRLLEREQIQHESLDGRVFADRVVQDKRVAGGEHRVGLLGELGDLVDRVVAQLLDAETVGEAVQLEQREVRRLAFLVEAASLAVVEALRVDPVDEVLEEIKLFFA
jgi:hypothetical protein